MSGVVTFREPLDTEADRKYLRLPCGNCIGCLKSKAREWAIRCTLELRDHPDACWVTLTYDDDHLPPTLSKDHLRAYIKRVRARIHPRSLRYFASGEYGEQRGRPHYHSIIYGLGEHETDLIKAWNYGRAQIDTLTPASIAYVAGYTAKKAGQRLRKFERVEEVDPRTGECFLPQPPFLAMSGKPGIGATARDKYWRSWRTTAIHSAQEVPAPRYLHQGWLKHTSPDEHIALATEKEQRAKQRGYLTKEQLKASGEIALAKHQLQAEKRKYG
jgi:hypothetical protein